MEKLDKAYEGMEMLRNIGLPISKDQIKGIYDLEAQYLTEEVIPQIKEVIGPLVNKVMNGFKMEVTIGEQEEVNIELLPPETENTINQRDANSKKRQKKYIIKVIFPDGHAVCSRMVWETLYEVVKYAGVQRVRKLGLWLRGTNIISDQVEEDDRYRNSQKEVEPGVYLQTCSTTEVKYEQIKEINKQLSLGLKIEKVLI
ncbi:MAG: hypothetical protein ACI3Y0_05765 [Prevotella sp.]